jgi:hypothetical protein
MLGDTTQDYMNAFVATFLVILSFLIIKEIRQSVAKSIFFIIVGIFSFWLGCNKIKRDNRKDALNESRHAADSVRLDTIINNYKADTTRFSDFNRKLETEFHIKDSLGNPVQIHNYKPTFNTNIGKANEVKIG